MTISPLLARLRLAKLADRPDPAVELVFALLALAAVVVSVVAMSGVDRTLGAALAALMVMIAFVDYRCYRIPNLLTAAAFALGLGHVVAHAPGAAGDAVLTASLRAAVLASLFLFFRLSYRWLRGREGIGLGDVKLAAVAGIWLDWSALPVAIQLAALTALSAYVGRQAATGRPLQANARLPFGLFFAPAIWLSWLLQVKFLA